MLIAGGFDGAFCWYGLHSKDREILKQIYQNYLVALIYPTESKQIQRALIHVLT